MVTDDAGAVFGGVAVDLDLQLVHLFDNVVIGDDVAVLVDDEAGARRGAAELAGHLATEGAVAEHVEQAVSLIAGPAFFAALFVFGVGIAGRRRLTAVARAAALRRFFGPTGFGGDVDD